ncbi:MAG TPA: YihY/virulence factor BrkB family protein [Bacillota bacterium]
MPQRPPRHAIPARPPGVGTATIRAVRRFLDHDGPTAAAAIAYYALFSLFPLLLVALAAAAFVLPDLPARRQVLHLVEAYVPGARPLIQENLARLVGIRSGVGAFGLIFFIWSASAVFAAVTRALDRAVERAVPGGRGGGTRPSPLRARLVGLAMVGITAAVLVAALAGTTWLEALRGRGLALPAPMAGVDRTAPWLTAALTFVTVLAAYRLVPVGAPPAGRLWPGALLAAAGLHAARSLFARYVATVEPGVLIYGSIGVVILTLLWFYLSAAILIFGLEWAVALMGPEGPAPWTAAGPMGGAGSRRQGQGPGRRRN